MKKIVYCSFCGKSQHDVAYIVAGEGVQICSECIFTCLEVIFEQIKKKLTKKRKPKETHHGSRGAST